MDKATFLGLSIAIVGILIGNAIEGGPLGALLQFTAALIVFGGTAGATIATNQWKDLVLALQLVKTALSENDGQKERVLQQLREFSQIARRETLLALEPHLKKSAHPFMKRVFRCLIDGVDHQQMRVVFQEAIEKEEQRLLAGSRVWLDAGGYAPTIGIIGAVLGLIHVMSHLTDTSQLGKGIAVAFVATIYGVGSANLVFLPLGQKIKRRIETDLELWHMILESGISIAQNLNPHLIDEKLRTANSSLGKAV